MPDKRLHRGKHPEDDNLFSRQNLDVLRNAVSDYSLLLSKGYPPKSSLKLIGDHFDLNRRQRLAVMRSSCSNNKLDERIKKEIRNINGKHVGVDGYNLLITVEAALAGGYLFIGKDGCIRDMASIHGTYRKVQETLYALNMIADNLRTLNPADVIWFLDKPVSNSGRLKKIILDFALENNLNWQVELVNNPDKSLIKSDYVVISSDSDILDKSVCWYNLARQIVGQVNDSLIIDLS